jgi:hypothetical protein
MKRASLRVSAVVAAAALVLTFCSSSPPKKSDSGLGTRVLVCVVDSREHDAGSSTSSYRGGGTGDYYMTFVTREGQATSRYRLPVTRQQYQRFQEGDRVRITLNNNILTNIQPAD